MQKLLLMICALMSWNSAMAVSYSTKSYELDNGLRLIVREDHRAPVIVSQIWYKVGAAKEPLGLTGISHALEHMMFQGTPKYPDDQFLKKIHRAGGSFNASTEYDWTNYYEVLSKEHLALSFELEADRMQNLNLHDQNFKKELQVVIEERRLRVEDHPSQVMQERFYAHALLANPYQNPVIGWQEDLDHMTVPDLRRWYDAWYAPNNAVLVVVGDVESEAVYQLAQKIFGAIPKKPLPEVKPTVALTTLGEKRLEVRIPAEVPMIALGYPVPTYATTRDLKETAALMMACMILDGGSSGRLTKKLIRTTEIAAGVEVQYAYQMQYPNIFSVMAAPTPGHSLAELEAALKAELADLQATLVSAEELTRAKTLWRTQETYAADSMMAQAGSIGMWEVRGLSWEMEEKLNAAMAAVSALDIQDVARRYLMADRVTVGLLVPQKSASKAQETL